MDPTRFTFTCDRLSEQTDRFAFADAQDVQNAREPPAPSSPLSFERFLALLAESADFRRFLTARLAESRFGAFRWELPSVTRETLVQPFEFVLVDDPGLEGPPEPKVFSGYFDEAGRERDGEAPPVLPISNVGGNAMLVVPRRIGPAEHYTHLARFVRHAPADQIDALWRCAAGIVSERVSERPLWLSTAGNGVAWLHLRVENVPKYYLHRPYASLDPVAARNADEAA